ncbi:MAG: UDP-2,3-diacylglucosamine diphosphatase LpxI [Planctomycetes bacterium]|nr:UDP-2,3-diacylglucosamine diphosphatase LpxI [Planctomycetota bacterium]
MSDWHNRPLGTGQPQRSSGPADSPVARSPSQSDAATNDPLPAAHCPLPTGLPTRSPVGLLAGSGRFPVVFAEAARRQGYAVVGVGIRDAASPGLAELCQEFAWAAISRVGRMIRLFKRAGVERIVMAGKVTKTLMFTPRRILRLLPDWRTLHLWYTYARRDKKDDTLLLALIREFQRDHLYFDSALDYCPELLVKRGCLTRQRPSLAQWKDIVFGWQIAKEMGRLDIGQTVVVKEQAVIAVEAIEGTDRTIRRAGEFCPAGNFTVVKVAKPHQDRRFDVPTVGTDTIHTLYQAGGKVLAVEAEQTILLDQSQVIELADRYGLCVVALDVRQDMASPQDGEWAY